MRVKVKPEWVKMIDVQYPNNNGIFIVTDVKESGSYYLITDGVFSGNYIRKSRVTIIEEFKPDIDRILDL